MAEPEFNTMQIRTGVGRFTDGWRVVVRFGDEDQVYEPAFATQEQAEAKRLEVRAEIEAKATELTGMAPVVLETDDLLPMNPPRINRAERRRQERARRKGRPS